MRGPNTRKADKLSLTKRSPSSTTMQPHAIEHEKLPTKKKKSLTPPSLTFFTEIYHLKPDQNIAALLAGNNYKVYVHVDSQSREMNQVLCLIETGAGTKAFKNAYLHTTWTPHINRQIILKLRSANKHPIS